MKRKRKNKLTNGHGRSDYSTSSCHLWKNSKRPNKGCSNCFHFSSVSEVFIRSSSLIQTLLLWRCLQWHNARFFSVLFDVAPCYWKSPCKIPRAQNSWRYESIVLTNRIARKRMNIKKIKLLIIESRLRFLDLTMTVIRWICYGIVQPIDVIRLRVAVTRPSTPVIPMSLRWRRALPLGVLG